MRDALVGGGRRQMAGRRAGCDRGATHFLVDAQMPMSRCGRMGSHAAQIVTLEQD
jgi:hypothetical protein